MRFYTQPNSPLSNQPTNYPTSPNPSKPTISSPANNTNASTRREPRGARQEASASRRSVLGDPGWPARGAMTGRDLDREHRHGLARSDGGTLRAPRGEEQRLQQQPGAVARLSGAAAAEGRRRGPVRSGSGATDAKGRRSVLCGATTYVGSAASARWVRRGTTQTTRMGVEQSPSTRMRGMWQLRPVYLILL